MTFLRTILKNRTNLMYNNDGPYIRSDGRSVGMSLIQSICQPTNPSTDELTTNQPTNPSTDELTTNQPTNQSIKDID